MAATMERVTRSEGSAVPMVRRGDHPFPAGRVGPVPAHAGPGLAVEPGPAYRAPMMAWYQKAAERY
jgi:hypothetical protein